MGSVLRPPFPNVSAPKVAELAAKGSFETLWAAFSQGQREPDDDWRAREYGYLAGGPVQLDHAGFTPACESLLRQLQGLLVAPMGGAGLGQRSARVAEVRERAQRAVLEHVGASAATYQVVFVPGAAAAAKLVAEAYPFSRAGRLLLSADNHNAVGGMRVLARARGAPVGYVPLDGRSLRLCADKLRATLAEQGPRRRFGARWRSAAAPGHLFAFPALSNFSGVAHPLSFVSDAQRWGWDVVLDATTFAASNRLDLGQVAPDFVLLSFAELLGYPVTAGCLLARKAALAKLQRPWFAGGSAAAVSVVCREHALCDGAAGFEDGPGDLFGLEAVAIGLEHLRALDFGRTGRRLGRLTGWLLEMAGALRHTNGAPVVRVFGPPELEARGPVVALSVLGPDGSALDPRLVQRLAAAAGLTLGAGWFDNPGAFEAAFGVEAAAAAWAFAGRPPQSFARYAQALGVPPGVVRISLGPASDFRDVFRALDFLRGFVDRATATASPSLPERPAHLWAPGPRAGPP